jgi:hypothetical protein
MEQRNGRIDRTLQPAPEVRCHYFVYPQRAEDQVLATVVRKIAVVQKDLGSIGAVLLGQIGAALEGPAYPTATLLEEAHQVVADEAPGTGNENAGFNHGRPSLGEPILFAPHRLLPGPRQPNPSEAVIARFSRELLESSAVTQETFDAVVARYGENGLFELVAVMSVYTFNANILRTMDHRAGADARMLTR